MTDPPLPSPRARLWAIIAAAAASLVLAVVLLATVGMGFASMLAWSCTHNPAPGGAGCGEARLTLRLVLILALCLLPPCLLFPHVRKWVLARFRR